MVGMLGEMADQPSGGRFTVNGTVSSAGVGGERVSFLLTLTNCKWFIPTALNPVRIIEK